MGGQSNITEAWNAAVEVVAGAYRVETAILKAESRGRGPRPPQHVWEAKKLAVYIAVAASNCDYAELARHIGLHRDTVTSHCAGVRERCADETAFEIRAEALIAATLHRLSRPAIEPGPVTEEQVTLAAMWSALEARMQRMEALLEKIAAHPTKSDDFAAHPTRAADHENVIKIPARGRR